ncbi:MAG: type II secretion system F family protein, partial [Pirellulaceae bacterium]
MNYGSANNPATQAGAMVQSALGRTPHVKRHPHRAAKPPRPSLFGAKVRQKDLVAMTSQLAIMTRSGIDVASSLQSLVRQQKSPVVRKILEDVNGDVLAGNSLSDSLAKYPHVFNGTYVASVAAGEA